MVDLPEQSINDNLDLAFLRDFASFGIYNHVLMADILSKALETADSSARKIYRVKLYSEFISAIEDFAGLCIAIADREEMSILGTYLFYGTKFKGQKIIGPGTFFAYTGREVDGRVEKWLVLPELDELYKELDPATYRIFAEGYRRLTDAINQAGIWYRLENRMAIGAYNKIKHGFVVTQGYNPIPPFFQASGDDAAVLYSEPSMAQEGKLLINGAMISSDIGVDIELEAIKMLFDSSKTLIDLFLILAETGLL